MKYCEAPKHNKTHISLSIYSYLEVVLILQRTHTGLHCRLSVCCAEKC